MSEGDFAVSVADRYFEDYVPGAVYEYGYASVTAAEIIAFAQPFDPRTGALGPRASPRPTERA